MTDLFVISRNNDGTYDLLLNEPPQDDFASIECAMVLVHGIKEETAVQLLERAKAALKYWLGNCYQSASSSDKVTESEA